MHVKCIHFLFKVMIHIWATRVESLIQGPNSGTFAGAFVFAFCLPVPSQLNYIAVSMSNIFILGGETIKNINQQSGAHVELQRNPPPNTDPNVRVFSIRGTPQQMEMARQLIDDKIGVRTISTEPSAGKPTRWTSKCLPGCNNSFLWWKAINVSSDTHWHAANVIWTYKIVRKHVCW